MSRSGRPPRRRRSLPPDYRRRRRAVASRSRDARSKRSTFSRLEPGEPLRRQLGSPALFALVQAFVAASVYFALGLVAGRALGYTWAVFVAAALFFALLVPSYVEGASLHQERGGATIIARYAFNELWSFVAGWAICLDYVILIAITAFVATDYAAVIWHPLHTGFLEFAMAVALIGLMAWLNVRGAAPRRFERAAFAVLADLVLQMTVVVLGLALLFEPEVITDPSSLAGTPSLRDLMFAFTLALVAFSGLDASSGFAGQVHIGRRGLRRLITARVMAAVVPYVGIALVASAALPLQELADGSDLSERPMVGVVEAFDQAWLREPLRYLVAIFALGILAVACNAAMLGLSRLGYSLAINRQIPSAVGRLHPRRRTPYVVIGIGAGLAVALLFPADLDFLGGIYAFGATLAFTLVHLSILALRVREPERDRPYKIPFNVRVRGVELPLPTLAGALMSAAAFVSVVVLHEGARTLGTLWMAFGVTLYVLYRLVNEKPVFKRVTVPEGALARVAQPAAEYGSILVPILGTPLDDDIVQTAGRLAMEEGDEEGEGGAVIEALWVFEIPLTLPLEAPVPDGELKRARAALQRAKAVGEEYGGVEVATATVRARRIGEAIVHEAKRRGVEAIVLAAEQPTLTRGGMHLGGKEGLRDSHVGEMTRHVVNKAPCRVILTAPPADKGRRDSLPLGAPAPPALDGQPPAPPAAVPGGGLSAQQRIAPVPAAPEAAVRRRWSLRPSRGRRPKG